MMKYVTWTVVLVISGISKSRLSGRFNCMKPEFVSFSYPGRDFIISVMQQEVIFCIQVLGTKTKLNYSSYSNCCAFRLFKLIFCSFVLHFNSVEPLSMYDM